MFNSGFIYEIANDHPNSIALSQNSIKRDGTLSEKIQLYNTIASVEEVKGATWLHKHGTLSVKTYADYDCRNDLLLAFALIPRDYSAVIYNTTKRLDGNSYVFMRKLNIVEGIMGGKQPIGHTDMFNATVIRFQLFHDSNLVYSNGGTEIYLTLHSVWISK
jgi:uncharacterized membrane protein